MLSIPWFWVWTDEDSSKSFGLETSWSVYTINLMITCINMAKYSCLWMDFSFVRRLLKEKMKRNDAVLQWKIVFPFHSSTCTSSSSVTNSPKKYFATNFSFGHLKWHLSPNHGHNIVDSWQHWVHYTHLNAVRIQRDARTDITEMLKPTISKILV